MRSAGAPNILPAREALTRLVGAVLAEHHDEWTEMRRYIGLDVLARCRRALLDNDETTQEVPLAAITAQHPRAALTGNRGS